MFWCLFVSLIGISRSSLISLKAATDYELWCTGTCDGTDVSTLTVPGAVLMGGSTDVDEAFEWQIEHANRGDFLILRASGADGYNVNINYFKV